MKRVYKVSSSPNAKNLSNFQFWDCSLSFSLYVYLSIAIIIIIVSLSLSFIVLVIVLMIVISCLDIFYLSAFG